MSTLNPTAFSIFADDPKDYASGDGEALADLIDEDGYDSSDFAADAKGRYDTEESDQGDVVLDDERADENDYSHGEGEPEAVEPTAAPVSSEELEEYERDDPT